MTSETDMTARLAYIAAAIRLVEEGRKRLRPYHGVERLVLNAFEAYPHYAFGVAQLTKIINAKERTDLGYERVRQACQWAKGLGVLNRRTIIGEGTVYELNLEV